MNPCISEKSYCLLISNELVQNRVLTSSPLSNFMNCLMFLYEFLSSYHWNFQNISATSHCDLSYLHSWLQLSSHRWTINMWKSPKTAQQARVQQTRDGEVWRRRSNLSKITRVHLAGVVVPSKVLHLVYRWKAVNSLMAEDGEFHNGRRGGRA